MNPLRENTVIFFRKLGLNELFNKGRSNSLICLLRKVIVQEGLTFDSYGHAEHVSTNGHHVSSKIRPCDKKVCKTLVIYMVLILCLIINDTLYSQKEWPQRSAQLVQGCYQEVTGKSLDYLQNLTPPNVAMVLDEMEQGVSFQSGNWQNIDFSDSLSLIIGVSVVGRQGDAAPFFSLLMDGIGAWENISWQALNNHPISLPHGTLYFIPAWHPEVELGTYGYLMINLPAHSLPSRGIIQFRAHLDQKSPAGTALYIYQDSLSVNLQGWVLSALKKITDEHVVQPLRLEWTHLGPKGEVAVFVDDKFIATKSVSPGVQIFEYDLDPVFQDTILNVSIKLEGVEIGRCQLNRRKVRDFEVHLLPHSHVDIGFTHRQEEVIAMQWEGFMEAIHQAERTASYPEEARFKWNVEVLWAVEQFMKDADPTDKAAFVRAVKNGSIGLDALFAGMLTGIQSGEEMMHNTDPAHWWRDQHQLDIRSAMITDIPGAQWALVPTLYHNGVRYLSMGPNHMPHMPDLGYQVGHTIRTWGDKPFYWESISGNEKVLVWMSRHGYSWFHPWLLGPISKKGGVPILKFLNELEDEGYPYDMVQLRYTLGDNAGPDGGLSDFVKSWNEHYRTPKLVINTTQAMFEQFEAKYSDEIPIVKGDFSPYWEDGVASSALETALNRQTAEQITQAEIVLSAKPLHLFPTSVWSAVWQHILLFSEHTWGSYSSKSDPDGQLALDQWAVKQHFALRAKNLADSLLGEWQMERLLLEPHESCSEVLNTQCFVVSDRVLVEVNEDPIHFHIFDEWGNNIETQTLSNGQLWVPIDTLMPFASRKFFLRRGELRSEESDTGVNPFIMNCGNLRLDWNETGDLVSMINTQTGKQWIDPENNLGFNRFWYSGVDTIGWQGASFQSIEWSERGPFFEQIKLVWNAPGCDSIVSLIGCHHALAAIDIANHVYKKKVLDDENGRFAFPFQLPSAAIIMDHPFGVMRPGIDQIDGSNVNFLCAQHWVFIGGESEGGIVWMSKDAPIFEVGEPHGQRWASDLKTRPWKTVFEPSSQIFSWVMNNVWFVNYKGYQEGRIDFRYRIMATGSFDKLNLDQKGLTYRQPLLVRKTNKTSDKIQIPFRISANTPIRLTSIKPTRNQKGWSIRLFNPSETIMTGRLEWYRPYNHSYKSDGTEERGEDVHLENLTLSPWEILTLIVE